MRSSELNGRADELFEALRSLQVPEFLRWLEAIAARLRDFGTFRNVLLIEDQKPAASDIRPFDDWQEVGRRIGRGERAIYLLRPNPRRNYPRYLSCPGFDVSQTSGEAVEPPKRLSVTAVEARVRALAVEDGVRHTSFALVLDELVERRLQERWEREAVEPGVRSAEMTSVAYVLAKAWGLPASEAIECLSCLEGYDSAVSLERVHAIARTIYRVVEDLELPDTEATPAVESESEPEPATPPEAPEEPTAAPEAPASKVAEPRSKTKTKPKATPRSKAPAKPKVKNARKSKEVPVPTEIEMPEGMGAECMVAGVNAAVLKKALTAVKPIAKTKHAVVGGAVRVEAVLRSGADPRGELVLTTSDLEVTRIERIPAYVAQEGVALLELERLEGVAKAAGKADLRLVALEGDRCEIQTGNRSVKLSGKNAADWPELPEVEGAVAIDAQALRTILARVEHAMSTDETRYQLNGVHFEVKEDPSTEQAAVTCVATDGHRLALAACPREEIGDLPMGFKETMPATSVGQALKKVITKKTKTLEMAFGPRHAVLRSSTAELYFQFIDGEFPDYRRVLPADSAKRTAVQIERGPLRGAVQAAMAVNKGKKREGVRLTVQSDHVEIEAEASDTGEASEIVPASPDRLMTDPVVTGWNGNYLIDVLSSIETEDVVISVEDPLSQALVTGVGIDRDEYAAIVMPMRI